MTPLGFDGLELRRGKGFGVIRNDGRRTVPHYALTPLGSTRAENGEIPGEKGEIADAIIADSAGKMTKREIANATRIEESRVGLLLKTLITLGYVVQAGGE